MPHSLLKLNPARNIYTKTVIKILKAAKISRFCCYFTLRQGTIMIAIVELLMTCFYLFLLLLCATHAQDILNLVTSDLQELEEDKEEGVDELQFYLLNNEKKMLLGQNSAFIIMFTIWTAVLLTSINLIICSLLLYGAIKNSPYFLLPWTSTGFFTVITCCFLLLLLVFMPIHGCKVGIFIVACLLYAMEFYAWLVVLSFYQELKNKELKLDPDGVTHFVDKLDKSVFSAPEIKHELC